MAVKHQKAAYKGHRFIEEREKLAMKIPSAAYEADIILTY